MGDEMPAGEGEFLNVESDSITKKHKKTPWITNGILRSINTRYKLYKKLKKTKIDSINYITKKTNINKYRNTFNKLKP